MVAGRPSPAPLGPVYPAGSALGGGWGLLWPYGNPVCGWGADAVRSVAETRTISAFWVYMTYRGLVMAALSCWWPICDF